LSKHIKVLKFSDLDDKELSRWITKYITSKGKSIEEEALDILKELQGRDLLNLSQELEKLITFCGGRKNITRNDVELLVGKSVLASAFDIADSVSAKDTARAIGIVYDLMSAGKKPYEIIGLLCWHFKRILKAKALLSKGSTEFSAGQLLRIPRRNAKEFFAQVRSFSSDQIEAKMQVLLETDLSIKRPRYSPSLIMEFAVIRLCL
jgi:DNA polymerase III subunit delta